MRTYIIALGTLVALSGAAAQQSGDPHIPLHPGGVGVKLENPGIDAVRIVGALPGSPAEAAGLGREDCALLAVDGHPVGYGGVMHALTALAGPVGTPVEVTVRRGRGVRTVRMVRADVLAPGAGYTQVVLSRHFVVHHRPVPEDAREARRVARDAEQRYADFRLPRDTRGRRAHLWVADLQRISFPRWLPAWVAYVRSQPGVTVSGDLEPVFGYLAYGDPGRVGDDFGATTGLGNGGRGPEQVRGAHMASAQAIEGAAVESRQSGRPKIIAPFGYRPPWKAYGAEWGTQQELSLRHYMLQRFGLARFRRVWASDLSFNDAVQRELGVSAEELLRDWETYVRTLGPDPEAPPAPGVLAGTLAWGALALL
ncbi:MAG TPA: PDZ domain-containing protein, partial [Longimicrobiaceae bacterium]|nr:PDZ domain-containing protein [Longimicrobiaceae bacterium]